MNRAIVVALIVVGLLAGLAAGLYVTRLRGEAPALERATLFETPRPLPALALVDQAGNSFDRERFHGRWTFLFFGFVNCPDVCPTTLATLAEVRRNARDLPPGDPPEVVLVSVDPGRDTPAVLAHYVAHFDPAFTGVTGNADAIEALTRQLDVAVIMGPPAADGNYAVDHTAAIFLIDPAGSVSALFGAPHEAGVIARDFRRILAARPGQE